MMGADIPTATKGLPRVKRAPEAAAAARSVAWPVALVAWGGWACDSPSAHAGHSGAGDAGRSRGRLRRRRGSIEGRCAHRAPDLFARHYVQGDLALYGNPLRLAQEGWLNGLGLLAADSWFQLRIMPATAVTMVAYTPVGGTPVEMDLADFYLEAERAAFHSHAWRLAGAGTGPTGVSVTFSA